MDHLKIVLVCLGLTLAYAVANQLDERDRYAAYNLRLAKLERAAWLYLPPISCSTCHNQRVGPMKGGKK